MHYCTCGDIHTSFRNISRLTAPSPSPRATRRRTKAWRCCSGRALMSPAPHPPSGEGEGGEEEFLLPGESARVTCRRSGSESGRWEPERPEFIRSNSPLKRLARSLNKYLVLPHQGDIRYSLSRVLQIAEYSLSKQISSTGIIPNKVHLYGVQIADIQHSFRKVLQIADIQYSPSMVVQIADIQYSKIKFVQIVNIQYFPSHVIQ